MSARETRHATWPVTTKLPKYYLPIQLLALILGYTAFLIASFIDGGIGPFSGIGLFLAGNFVLGVIAGTTSTSLTRAFLVMIGCLVGGILFAYLILTLPTTLGVPDDTLVYSVILGMSAQIVFSLLSFAPSVLAIIIGSAIHDSLGLPDE